MVEFLCFELLATMRERPPSDQEAARILLARSGARTHRLRLAARMAWRRTQSLMASRTGFLLLSLALVGLVSASAPAHAEEGNVEIRIGYQKSGTLAVLREKPELAARLARQRVLIQWVEFQSGPPLLEALNAGGVDFGYTGDAPPIFAQAAQAHLVYVGYLPNPGRNLALLVRKESAFAKVSDLKGRRVAFTKGSSAHNFVVKALQAAGLAYDDIKPAYLQPADAAAAFRNGSVDAWAIWDPFYAQTERAQPVRVLTTAEGVAPSNSFFLANRDYAARHPEIIADLVRDLDDASRWSEIHQDAVAQIIAALTGVELGAEKASVARSAYGVHFLTPEVIAQQQAVADSFRTLGLIPSAIDVGKAVWTPPGLTAAVTPR